MQTLNMAVSKAFNELSAVLVRLETAGTDVRAVEVRESELGSGGELTAKLSVAVPLFAASAFQDSITIKAENTDMEDQRVLLNLTVTVPVKQGDPPNAQKRQDNQSSFTTKSDSTPAYKDPEALAAAYAECDTFPEMTEALGVDVTSETVRRHAIKHNIHDPGDSIAHPRQITSLGKGESTDTGDNAGETNSDTVDRTTTPRSRETDAEVTETGENEQSRTGGSGNPVVDDTNGGPNASVADKGESEPANQEELDVTDPPLADRSITELLSKNGEEEGGNTVVTDGLGISPEVTVGRLTRAINQSRTIHEAKQNLNMSRDNTQQLLDRYNLLDFVTHPLANGQIKITPEEVVRRFESEND